MKAEVLSEMPKAYEDMLIICNTVDANALLQKNIKMADCLVIANVIPVGELTVVPKKEFLRYIEKGLTE